MTALPDQQTATPMIDRAETRRAQITGGVLIALAIKDRQG